MSKKGVGHKIKSSNQIILDEANTLEVKNILFKYIRMVVNEASEKDKKEKITDTQLEKLLYLAKSHDLTHFVAKALKECKECENENLNKIYNESVYWALYRYEQKQYVINQIVHLFEEENIPFILLKGSVLCHYYPQAWLRTSCDVDVLVHESALEKAVNSM